MEHYSYSYIIITVDKPKYRYEFQSNNPLILGESPEIGLKSLFMWYTYPNISEKYNNNTLTISQHGVSKHITIPKGMYEVSALSDFINSQLQSAEQTVRKKLFSLVVNESTFKCIVKIAPNSNLTVDFSEGQLHELLGLDPKIYTEGSEEGKQIINITRGVDKVFIRCSLVNRPFQQEFSDTLYDILPYSQPGAAIQEQIEHVEYHKCKDKFIKYFDIKITDRNGDLLEFSEPVSLKLAFRSII